MDKTKICIYLDDEVFSSLKLMAQRDMRNLRNQCAIIIRERLEHEGLLLAEPVDGIGLTPEMIEFSTKEMDDEKKST